MLYADQRQDFSFGVIPEARQEAKRLLKYMCRFEAKSGFTACLARAFVSPISIDR
jgi:hypothetical protein